MGIGLTRRWWKAARRSWRSPATRMIDSVGLRTWAGRRHRVVLRPYAVAERASRDTARPDGWRCPGPCAARTASRAGGIVREQDDAEVHVLNRGGDGAIGLSGMALACSLLLWKHDKWMRRTLSGASDCDCHSCWNERRALLCDALGRKQPSIFRPLARNPLGYASELGTQDCDLPPQEIPWMGSTTFGTSTEEPRITGHHRVHDAFFTFLGSATARSAARWRSAWAVNGWNGLPPRAAGLLPWVVSSTSRGPGQTVEHWSTTVARKSSARPTMRRRLRETSETLTRFLHFLHNNSRGKGETWHGEQRELAKWC